MTRSLNVTLTGLVLLMAVTIMSLSVEGCSWDEEFSADSRYYLTFSDDTVRVDTVFTGVTSASQWFMIYNRNEVGVRLDAVLGGGESSPFRINLDGQGGHQITGLDIPAGDSLFCFVSVNIPQSDSPELFNAFDSIRFILESGNVQHVRLSASGQNAVRLRNSRIESNTRLSANLPYIIFDTLSVASGAVLTLEPGCRLYFHSGAMLDVEGRIVAQGKPDSIILMRGDRLDYLLEGIQYDCLDGLWGGVRLRSGSYGNVFSYCDIHSGEYGIKADSARADELKFSLVSSVVHNVNGSCIEATGCMIKVANSQITNGGSYCVDVAGGASYFDFCTIASFSIWNLGRQAVLLTDFRDDRNVTLNEARFNNCIITGRHSEEFVSILSDSVKNLDIYKISNSLVMTSDTLDSHYENVTFDRHGTPWGGASGFKGKTMEGYRSVFRLDSLSKARGIAFDTPVEWAVDLDGVTRPLTGADAGCYQYTGD